ncbi:hypothetical protein LWI29_007974 [Acer saccharum]|uniref:Uncharacterized protein n=1 Tax=Acer saccharum TaxID=4024 RepID=A0AA39RCK0_ACESA|nr:hypothetical protein LWI29_007974 [Acer saccharum]
MFTRIFGKPKQESNALTTLDKLNETLEMLEKKEKVLLKKASAEVEKAKDFSRAKNKRAAIQCLKRKRLYEQQIEQLGNFQLRIHDQMIMLEGAKATTETVDALRTGAAAMKAMQKATNIDDVDKTMDEINEQTENMKQIQEALSTPIGSAADFDEDELEAELEELEGAELEEQLLQPATTAPAAPVAAPSQLRKMNLLPYRLRWHFKQVLSVSPGVMRLFKDWPYCMWIFYDLSAEIHQLLPGCNRKACYDSSPLRKCMGHYTCSQCSEYWAQFYFEYWANLFAV